MAESSETRAGGAPEIHTRGTWSVGSRLEVVYTILMDGLMIAVAIGVRAGILWLMRLLLPADEPSWAIVIAEAVVDFGFVTTVLLLTVFDLLKRLFVGWRRFRAPET